MHWQPDALWGKANLYMGRALDEDRDDPLFPFWSSLALEFLARAAVASVHPTLLAEPHNSMQNVLYALGQPAPKTGARSIPANLVFALCKQLVPSFGPEELALCESLSNRRNEELHSGGMAFDAFPTAIWLARFYRTCRVLLLFQEKALGDFLGAPEAEVAERMIADSEHAVIEKVKRSIGAHQSLFNELSEPEKKELLSKSQAQAELMASRGGHRVICPSCGACSWVIGERIVSQGSKVEGDCVVERTAMLPTGFSCIACGLVLKGHAELHVAGIGGQYTHASYYEAVEYYAQDVQPEYEYNNE
jgi:hypothetical protein